MPGDARGRLWRERVLAELSLAAAPLRDEQRSLTLTTAALGPCAAAAAARTHEEFHWDPARAARAVAVASIEHLDRLAPVDAVQAALDELAAGTSSVGRYAAELTPGGRSQLVRRCLELVVPVAARPRTTFRFARVNFNVGHRGLVELKAVADLRRVPPERLEFGLLRVSADSAEALEFLALVATASASQAPVVVRGYRPALGDWCTVEVTDELLDGALTAVMARVAELVGDLVGVDAPPTPGPQCRYCPVAPDCPSGTSHLAGPRRVGGLPVGE